MDGTGTKNLLRHCRQLLGLMLGQQRGAKLVQIPIHDLLDFVQRQVDAVIRYPPLGKIVSADTS
jgi:hypothetical protein